jgi:sugar phosphate isomerase/epimerase
MPKKKDEQKSNIELGSDVFFDMESENWNRNKGDNPQFLISTDTLPWYGLDLIFDLVKSNGFDGIDLAMWKNFDSWNVNYVKKLSEKYDLPIRIVQVSNNVNEKEINKALDLCDAVWADTLCINAPKYFNYKSFNFIADNINFYRKHNKNLNFSIINPEDSNFFVLPIPKYRFTNIVEIIKKYGCYIGLDIANMDVDGFEYIFMRKLNDFLPYVSVLYLSDKTKLWEWHVIPGEWVMKIPNLLKKMKEKWFYRYISVKVNITKSDLSDPEKVDLILKKIRNYLKENYENAKID